MDEYDLYLSEEKPFQDSEYYPDSESESVISEVSSVDENHEPE